MSLWDWIRDRIYNWKSYEEMTGWLYNSPYSDKHKKYLMVTWCKANDYPKDKWRQMVEDSGINRKNI